MAYSQSDPFSELRRAFYNNRSPFCNSLIVINIVLFLANFFTHNLLGNFIGSDIVDGHANPIWGMLTFPLLTPDFIGLVFACFWLFSIGGSLERSWGIQRFAGFFALTTLAFSIPILIGSKLLHSGAGVIGLWLPLTSITCAWAAINPRQPMLFYFVLNVEARWIALLMVGIVYFEQFASNFILGLFALISPALAYYFARGDIRFPSSSIPSRGPDLRIVGGGRRPSVLDGSRRASGIGGWWQDMQERRRLRKLLKDSGFNDRD